MDKENIITTHRIRWSGMQFENAVRFEYVCKHLGTGLTENRILYTSNRNNLLSLLDFWNHDPRWKYWSKD